MTKQNADSNALSADAENAAREYSQDETEEWDDTPTALFLRAFFTFLGGAFLIFSVTRAPLSNFDAWRVTQSYLLAFLFLPLGVVWLFFAQSIRHVSYLKNQALNAWNYGFNFRFSRDENAPSSAMSRVLASPLFVAIALCIVLLPLLFFTSRGDEAREIDAALFPANASTRSVSWLPFLLITAFCREWFFRGFLLFGIAQGFRGAAAPIVGIVLQAAMFAAAMGAMGNGTFLSATNIAFFVAGLLLGAVAWKQKSFVAPFFAHAFALAIWFLFAP